MHTSRKHHYAQQPPLLGFVVSGGHHHSPGITRTKLRPRGAFAELAELGNSFTILSARHIVRLDITRLKEDTMTEPVDPVVEEETEAAEESAADESGDAEPEAE